MPAEVSDAAFFAPDELPGRVEPFHVQVAAYARKVIAGEVVGQPRAPALVAQGGKGCRME